MKINAKIDYACRALIELCLHWPNTSPVQISVIAERQRIPMKFLTHILIQLKQLGYVNSVRGKTGGYVLKTRPKEILLSDVFSRLGGLPLSSPQQGNQQHPVLQGIWKEIDDVLLKRMKEINFEQLCDRVRQQNQALMFDI